MGEIQAIHEGRDGYVEVEGKRYPIEMFPDGSFSIHFPAGNQHTELQKHLDALKAFATSKNPQWFVENRSKNYR